MTLITPPVVRCPICGGWLARRVLHVAEPTTIAVVCGMCAWDGEVIAGALVGISRAADATTQRDRARVAHADAVEVTRVRKRTESKA